MARRIFDVLVVMQGLVVPRGRRAEPGRATSLSRADAIAQARGRAQLGRLVREYLELRDGLVDPIRQARYICQENKERARRLARGEDPEEAGDD